MRRSIIAVIAIAIIAILLIAAFELSAQNGNDKSALSVNNGSGSNGNTNNSGQQTSNTQSLINDSSQNVTATSPETVLPGNEHFSLATSYPGVGNASYTYDWNHTFNMTVTATSAGSWNGRVAILAFVNKVGANIGPGCMVLSYDGNSTEWSVTNVDGTILENGHILVFTTDDASEYTYHLIVGFNETGTGVYDCGAPGL